MKKQLPNPKDQENIDKDAIYPNNNPEKEFDTFDPEESFEDIWVGKMTGKTGDRKIDNRRKPEDKPIGNSSMDADYSE